MVRRPWTLAAVWLLVIASVGLAAGCAREAPQGTERVVPELVLEDLRFRVYRDARLAARGTAQRASYRRDTSDLGADQIQVNLEQSRNGRVTIDAPSGRGNARSRDFAARGGVRLVQKGTTATTEEAHYSPADGFVRGGGPITVHGPSYTLTGPGFFLDPATEELHVVGGARVTAGRRESP